MLRLARVGLAAAALSSFSALAEPGKITVVGESKTYVVPDAFVLDVALFNVAEDSQTAMEKLSSRLADFRQQIGTMQGLETLSISTEQMRASTYDLCGEYLEENVESLEDCDNGIYSSRMDLTLTGTPANAAGNLVSFVSELGADQVEIDKFIVTDENSAKEAALMAAVEDARAKAERLAAVSGLRLGKVLDLSDSVRFSNGFKDGDTVTVTGSAVRPPRFTVVTEPEPVEFTGRVQMIFEILEGAEAD